MLWACWTLARRPRESCQTGSSRCGPPMCCAAIASLQFHATMPCLPALTCGCANALLMQEKRSKGWWQGTARHHSVAGRRSGQCPSRPPAGASAGRAPEQPAQQAGALLLPRLLLLRGGCRGRLADQPDAVKHYAVLPDIGQALKADVQGAGLGHIERLAQHLKPAAACLQQGRERLPVNRTAGCGPAAA